MHRFAVGLLRLLDLIIDSSFDLKKGDSPESATQLKRMVKAAQSLSD